MHETIIEKILALSYPISKSNPDSCLIFCGYLNSDGYGVLGIRDKKFYVHRIILEHKLGRKLKSGYQACHIPKCKRRNCIREDHLYEGTNLDNMGDKIEANPFCINGHDKRIYGCTRGYCRKCNRIRNAAYRNRKKN